MPRGSSIDLVLANSNIPKSAITVIESLKGSNGSMKDIRFRTNLPERTIRFALHSLKERGIVMEGFDFTDMRRKTFRLAGNI